MPLLLTPEYVGVSTVRAHVRRALEFTQKTDVYVAIGKTTPWDGGNLGGDDTNPPEPDADATALTEVVGYKKISQNTLVVPDDNGTIEIYGVKWRTVDANDAYTEKARHVWIQAQINYDELPVDISYRQIGIFSGLVRDPVDLAANPGRTVLLPVHVDDPGIIEYIYHDRPIPRALNRRDIINVVITF